jgi:hypothetical protein
MKRILSLLLLSAIVHFSFAQLAASNDTTICRGQAAQLNVTGGTTYTWTPNTGLTGANTANPVATPNTTTTYVVSSPISNAEMVVNGDFSQGNTGFTSQYTFEPLTNTGSGGYFVGGNANHWNPNMSSACTDHTGGVDSNMLIANGALTQAVPVWCQTFSVYPNVDYNLSCYIAELHNQNYPVIQWMVNGVRQGGGQRVFYIFPCPWSQYQITWNSGVNTSATFCLIDTNIQGNGNDFIIDDISITASGTIRDTVVVTVVNAPTVDLGNDTAICAGRTVLLNAGNAGAGYHWSDNTSAQTLSATTAGTYAVTVTANNCTATDAIDIDQLTLTVTTASVNTTCGQNNGQASVSPDNGSAPFSYVWSTTATNDTITGLAGGAYTVTVLDGVGCSATGAAVVNTSGSGNVSITGTNLQFCPADSARISAPSGYAAYLWNTGATDSVIHPHNAGNYYVTVTDNGNCTAESNHLAVSVFPVPPVSVSKSGDTLSAFNANSYQWYLNGNQISGATNSIYIATQAGNYTVQITDSNGCTALSNPLVVSGINDFAADVTIDVYPNPTSTEGWQLMVGAGLLGKELELTDASGRVIYQSRITNLKTHIDLQISAGIYLLKVTAGNKSYLRKLVKL